MLVAISAGSLQAGPKAYIGLFTDDYHSVCSQTVPAPFVGFELWVWVLPSDNGVKFVRTGLEIPGWIINTGQIINPDHMISLGCMDPICIMLASCYYDWVWLYRFSLIPTELNQGYVRIINGEDGQIHYASCLEGNPEEDLTVFNQLGVNLDCVYGSTESSWGAIKSICSE